ncbi:hypothetical protein [Methylobacterium platani]|uniref:Uncharacterized protein n=2 Tax=Methylobacterium platani TaxID=427683 RepID=A0A179SIS3_9HYPH|nr:hypothetical protein [Methylobacterium platani]KMO19069.1 hypothetical protein SQ03_08610 [Methylobacterium platani JCM 14648]OAS27352.1 hypothetical protein A5481_02725 [Methylobacterium platani]
MKKMTLGLAAAAVLGTLTFGIGAASAAPASPAGIQAAPMVETVQMTRGERRMMRHHRMHRHMMHRRHMMRHRMMHRHMHRM